MEGSALILLQTDNFNLAWTQRIADANIIIMKKKKKVYTTSDALIKQ